MYRCSVLALACGFLLASFLPATATARTQLVGIQGDDDRQTVEGPGYPWRSIGRVNNNGRSFCTGVLIAENRVLTAAHCVRSHVAGRAWASPRTVHFLAGYSRGSYQEHSTAISISVAKGDGLRRGLENDFAVITLARPIGKRLHYLPVETFAPASWRDDRRDGVRYTQAGYSQDRAHVLTRHSGCGIRGFLKSGRVFAHTCDATHGDSGSPILVRRNRDYAVIGLHIASSRNGQSGVAISGLTLSRGIAGLERTFPLAYKR